MNIEARLERLEDAHRSLSAQHTGLMAVVRAMLPLIEADPALVRRLLTSAYDIYSEHMDNAQHDEGYDADVRASIDLLSKTILAAADTRQRHSAGR